METEDIVGLVLKMKVPLEVKYDKVETLKWQLSQAVDLTKSYLIRELLSELKIKQSWNQN